MDVPDPSMTSEPNWSHTFIWKCRRQFVARRFNTLWAVWTYDTSLVEYFFFAYPFGECAHGACMFNNHTNLLLVALSHCNTLIRYTSPSAQNLVVWRLNGLMVRQKPTSHLFAFHFHEHERKSLCHGENTWLNWWGKRCNRNVRFSQTIIIIINWKCFHSFSIQIECGKVGDARTAMTTALTQMKGTQAIDNWIGIIIVKKASTPNENTLELVDGNLFTIRSTTLASTAGPENLK